MDTKKRKKDQEKIKILEKKLNMLQLFDDEICSEIIDFMEDMRCEMEKLDERIFHLMWNRDSASQYFIGD